jgi:hypothetical protein
MSDAQADRVNLLPPTFCSIPALKGLDDAHSYLLTLLIAYFFLKLPDRQTHPKIVLYHLS